MAYLEPIRTPLIRWHFSNTTTRELAEHVQETLGPHREVLEALAELDNELSDDAERALAIHDKQEAQE